MEYGPPLGRCVAVTSSGPSVLRTLRLVFTAGILAFGLLYAAGTVGTGIAPVDRAGDTTVAAASSFLDRDDSAQQAAEPVTTETATATATDDDRFTATATDGEADDLNVSELERAVHRRVNEVRESEGLDPLVWDDDLQTIAGDYSHRMADEGFFGHESPDGDTFEDRYDQYGYECEIQDDGETHLGGENLLRLSVSRYVDGEYAGKNETLLAKAIVTEWLNSPDHRETMLDDRWNRHGIGIAMVDGEAYVTHNFC